jgi:drug/metabolite transporter (DMT)-like permease
MQGQVGSSAAVRAGGPSLAGTTFLRSACSTRARSIVALVAVNVIWGTTFVATKPMLDRVPPLTTASVRFAIALLVLLPFVLRGGGRIPLGRGPLVMGLTGGFLVYLCQNTGLLFTSAANGSLIHGGIPALTALLAMAVLGERLGGRRAAGIALSLAGVAAVVLFGGGGQAGLAVVGDTLILASALALAGYIAAARAFFPTQERVLDSVAGTACYGLLFLVPASAVEIAMVGMPHPSGGDVIRLFYMGVFASALAFALWGYGLRHIEAGQAAIFANLTPLVGVAVAAVLLGEAITPLQVAGGALILGGVWLVTQAPGTPRASRAPVAGCGGDAAPPIASPVSSHA